MIPGELHFGHFLHHRVKSPWQRLGTSGGTRWRSGSRTKDVEDFEHVSILRTRRHPSATGGGAGDIQQNPRFDDISRTLKHSHVRTGGSKDLCRFSLFKSWYARIEQNLQGYETHVCRIGSVSVTNFVCLVGSSAQNMCLSTSMNYTRMFVGFTSCRRIGRLTVCSSSVWPMIVLTAFF